VATTHAATPTQAPARMKKPPLPAHRRASRVRLARRFSCRICSGVYSALMISVNVSMAGSSHCGGHGAPSTANGTTCHTQVCRG
jgi:hypothetical protein